MLSFENQYKKSEQAVAQLAASPLWYLTAAGAQQTAEQPEIIGVLHSKTGHFYKCQDLDTFLKHIHLLLSGNKEKNKTWCCIRQRS